MKKQYQIKTNFKNKKNRFNLYNRTFMNWNLESRLATFQDQAIKLALYSGDFLHDVNNAEKYKAFSEAIGSMETMIELAKLSIEPLSETSANSKYIKLQNLKDLHDKADADKLEISVEDSENPKSSPEGGAKHNLSKEDIELLEVDFEEIKPIEKTFLQKLLFWKK